MKQTNSYFCFFFAILGTFRPPVFFSNFRLFCAAFQTVNISLQLSKLVPSTIPVVDKSINNQCQISSVPLEAIKVDPAIIRGNRTRSSVNYESSPVLVPDRALSQSAG